MRIGIDARELRRGQMTGIGRYLLNILSFLADHKSGHTYVLYGDAETDLTRASDAFERRFVKGPCTLWRDQIGMARAARRDGLALFFSPFVKAPLRAPCPIVHTVHDLLFLRLPEYRTAKRWLYHRLFLAQAKAVARRAARVLTVSECSKRDVVEFLGVSPEKVTVVPNVVSSRFRPIDDAESLAATKAALGIERPYVLYVGNLGPHKNVMRLIDAFAALPERLRRSHELVIVAGRDHRRDVHERRAIEMGVGERVRFLDYVSDDELVVLHSGAALFAFPSLYEGFGLPPLEAMACGAPTIVADASSLPEVVGDAALKVDPRDVEAWAEAIARVLDDAELSAELRTKGLVRAAEFRPERIVPRLVAVWEECVDHGA